MVIHCRDPRCDVALDQTAYGAIQMVAHMWGSHGIGASEAEFLPTIETPQENKEEQISHAETVDTFPIEEIKQPEIVDVVRVEEKPVIPARKKK